MTFLVQTLLDAAAICERLRLEVALIGGLAVSLRVEPRFTRDVDVAVVVADDRRAEAVVKAFRDAGYELRSSYENETVDRLAAVRLVPPGGEGEGIVDLFFSYTGIEDMVVAAAEPMVIPPDHQFPVANLGHLLALKVLAGRPTDLQDARAILEAAGPGDLAAARDALAMIEQRAVYPRREKGERQLSEELEELIRTGPGEFRG